MKTSNWFTHVGQTFYTTRYKTGSIFLIWQFYVSLLIGRRVHTISDWIEKIGDIQIIVRQADSFAPNLGSKKRNVAHLLLTPSRNLLIMWHAAPQQLTTFFNEVLYFEFQS